MSAFETILKIGDNENLLFYPFKYCFVNDKKIPFKATGVCGRINNENDFISFAEILQYNPKIFEKYAGLGISIQASKIVAIDVDHCFSVPFDLNSSDDRAKDLMNIFNDAYIEFSFSGKGMRILFLCNEIVDYSKKYYIKNDKTQIEFYHYLNKSYRYVTITGETIINNSIKEINFEKILFFLNKYMKRNESIRNEFDLTSNYHNETNDDVINKRLRKNLLLNYNFREVWFSEAPGSGSNESQLDYQLISLIYELITTDKNKVKDIFESSPYFKSKDTKHINKWNYNHFRYFEYIFERVKI